MKIPTIKYNWKHVSIFDYRVIIICSKNFVEFCHYLWNVIFNKTKNRWEMKWKLSDFSIFFLSFMTPFSWSKLQPLLSLCTPHHRYYHCQSCRHPHYRSLTMLWKNSSYVKSLPSLLFIIKNLGFSGLLTFLFFKFSHINISHTQHTWQWMDG